MLKFIWQPLKQNSLHVLIFAAYRECRCCVVALLRTHCNLFISVSTTLLQICVTSKLERYQSKRINLIYLYIFL